MADDGCANPRATEAAASVGSGTLMAVAPGQGIAKAMAAYTSISRSADQSWVAALDLTHPDAVLAEAAVAFMDWAPSLKRSLPTATSHR